MSKKTFLDEKIFPEDMGFDEALNRLARVNSMEGKIFTAGTTDD